VSPQPEPNVDPLLLKVIERRRLLRFCYRDGERIVAPHDYGVHNGVVKLPTDQVGGAGSRRLPNWRWMETGPISGVRILDQTVPGGRPTRRGKHRKWDKLFIRGILVRGGPRYAHLPKGHKATSRRSGKGAHTPGAPRLPLAGPETRTKKEDRLGEIPLDGNRPSGGSRDRQGNFPPIVRADGVSVDVATLAPLSASVLAVYLSLLAKEHLAEAQAMENNRVYSTAVVIWLMKPSGSGLATG
jgi:hypothetical protein